MSFATAIPVLTDRQAEVFAFIQRFMVRFDRPPTMREIADRFGFASHTGATFHLKALTRKGLIRPDRAGQNPRYVPAVGALVAEPDADGNVRVGTTGPVVLSPAEFRAWLLRELAQLEAA